MGAAPGASAAAESLFQEGIAALKAGKLADACPLFEASHKLEPRSGTLIALASCNDQIGRTATAWAQYKDAAALARSENRPANAEKARQLGDALAPRLSKLRVEARDRPPGLVVKVGDVVLAEAAFGIDVAMDPGEHTITASAHGRRTWTGKVVVGKDGARATAVVPALELVPGAAPTAAAGGPRGAEPARDEPRPRGGVPVWAWIAGGVGIACAGASVAFLVDWRSTDGTLDDTCGAGRASCPPGYDFEADRARETRSYGLFWGFGAGAVLGIGAGVIGIVTAPPAAPSSAVRTVEPAAWAAPDGGGAALRGRF